MKSVLKLELEEAKVMVEAAKKAAESVKALETICIVDDGGCVIALERMNGARKMNMMRRNAHVDRWRHERLRIQALRQPFAHFLGQHGVAAFRHVRSVLLMRAQRNNGDFNRCEGLFDLRPCHLG